MRTWHSICIIAWCFLLLASYTVSKENTPEPKPEPKPKPEPTKPAPDPNPEIIARNNMDMTVCAGEDVIGYISNKQDSWAQFYVFDEQGNPTPGLGTCGCAPVGASMDLWLWSCAEWPQQHVDWKGIKTIPYCTRMTTCPPFGQRLTMDAMQRAKICQGSQEVGLLYSTGQAMPNSGKSKDMVAQCSCSTGGNGKPSIFSCEDATAMKVFGKDDKSNPFVCVTPQQACDAGSEIPKS